MSTTIQLIPRVGTAPGSTTFVVPPSGLGHPCAPDAPWAYVWPAPGFGPVPSRPGVTMPEDRNPYGTESQLRGAMSLRGKVLLAFATGVTAMLIGERLARRWKQR